MNSESQGDGSPNSPSLAASLPSLSKSGLGSLSDAARRKQINSARMIFIFIGLLTVVVNAFMFANTENEIDGALKEELKAAGLAVSELDPAQYKEIRDGAIRMAQLIYGGTIAVGFVYFGLALVISRHPLPIALTGLIIYVALAIAFALLNPASLVQGIIIKVIIVIALVRAVIAAAALRKAGAA